MLSPRSGCVSGLTGPPRTVSLSGGVLLRGTGPAMDNAHPAVAVVVQWET